MFGTEDPWWLFLWSEERSEYFFLLLHGVVAFIFTLVSCHNHNYLVRYVNVMKGLLNKSSACLLACVEPELVPPGVKRNSFTLDEVQSLYGITYTTSLFAQRDEYDFIGHEVSVQLIDSKAYPNNVEDNTFMLTWT